MLKKLKDLRVILIFLLVISWVVAVILFMSMKNDSKAQLAAKDSEISTLQAQITDIGELTDAYIVAADVPSGKVVEETDITPIKVPVGAADNLPSSSEELVGKHFKIGMTAGSVISRDCVYEEVLAPDTRYYDVVVDVLPIGLKIGDFVDVRIKYGTGADYIGVSHKQVEEINGNALKLKLSEEDIQMYSSMLADNIVFNQSFDSKTKFSEKTGEPEKIEAVGSYIYVVSYIDPGVQTSAKNFYSPSVIVQNLLVQNPNIFEGVHKPEDLILQRNLIEAGLSGGTEDTAGAKISTYIVNAIKEGQKIYDKRIEDALEAEGM